MKLLLLVVCFCCFWFGTLCSEPVTKDDFNGLKGEVREIASTMSNFMTEIRGQFMVMQSEVAAKVLENLLNDTTIEERVTILEFQVESLNTEVTDLTVEVTDQGDEIDVIDGEVAALFTDQVIQDERILELESESEDIQESINELRVTDIELTSAVIEAENRITALNMTVTDTVQDVAELQDEMSQLVVTGSVAFHVSLGDYDTMPVNTVVIFPEVGLNLGNGYDNATGQFTVPSGGAGLYYFYVQILADNGEEVGVDIRKNEVRLCRAYAGVRDENDATESPAASCGAVLTLVEGDVVDAFVGFAPVDDTPINDHPQPHNSFSGFRIAPE